MPAPKRAPGLPLSSPVGQAANLLDQALVEAEAGLARASAEQANGGDPDEVWRLVLELLAKVAALRDVIVGLLREHHCGHDVLVPLLGSSSTRLDRIFAILDAELLDEHEHHESVQGCLETCRSIEHILDTAGLEAEPSLRPPSEEEPFRWSPVPPAAEALLPDLPSPERDKASEGGGSEETLPSVDSEGQMPLIFSPGVQSLGDEQWPTGSPPLTPRMQPESDSPDPSIDDEWSPATPTGMCMEKVAEDAPQTPPCSREHHEHIFASGGRYKGEWLQGLRDGHGSQSWPGGEHYEGQFRRGGVHGEGVYRQPDGLCHGGQWARGKQHGHGSETFPDGTRYTGQYKAGCKSGKGTYTFAEGSVYEGQFLDNAIHGHGTYIWTGGGRGRKYHGQWSKNQMHGFGEFTFADGRRYSGEYVHDQKSGEGTFTWPDGREYSGQWLRGKQHGKARYKNASGEVHVGTWSKGKPKRITV